MRYSSGISQPPNSANFAPRAACRSWRGDCFRDMHGKLPQQRVGTSLGGSSLAWPTVTTYTLRKGSPAKTRTDLVVIGVAKSGKGDLVACPGAEDVAAEYGRKFKPMLSSMGFRGDAGEVLRVPTGGAIKAGQLLVVGLGDRDAPHPRARTPGRRCRRPQHRQRRLGGAGPARPRRRPRPRRGRRASSRAPTPSSSTSRRSDDAGVAEVSVLSDAARRQDAIAALEAAQAVAGRRPPGPRLGEHPAQRPDARAVRRRRAWPSARSARAGRSPRSRSRSSVPTSSRSSAAAASSASAMGSANPPRLVKLTWAPEDARGQGRLRRQGRHLRLRRADHQARQLDGDHEVRHGRRGRRDRRDLRDRRARAARSP